MEIGYICSCPLLEQKIAIGDIVYFPVDFSDGKGEVCKYFVYVGSLNSVGLFFKINTKNNQKYCDAWFRLQPSVYPFLDHESFLNCSKTVKLPKLVPIISGQLPN